MALGEIEKQSTYLKFVGGLVWDGKQTESHPKYLKQKYKFNEEERFRDGAAWGFISGVITKVAFVDSKFGRNLNVTINDNGEEVILSNGTKNNKYSNKLMQAILNGDLSKPFKLVPYEFPDSKDSSKLVNGISAYQEGKKLNLIVDGEPTKDDSFFKSSSKKIIPIGWKNSA